MTEFIANTVVVDDSDDDFILVGFADEQNGEYRDAIHFQRSYEFDEQDMALGMGHVYVERGIQAGSGYGGFEDAYSEIVLKTLRDFEASKKPVASICVGALPLAKSGILHGKRATTYHLMNGKRRRQLADLGAEVVDASIVRDDNKITSTSPATAIDVALALVETLTSQKNSERIRQLMGFAPLTAG